MSKARNIADLLDANGDVALSNLDNVPPADLVNDTSPQLGGDLDTNGNDINFGDSDALRFGDGLDLRIYHDGSNSYIRDAGTGDLTLAGTHIKATNAAGTANHIYCNSSADTVSLYGNNSVKLATTSTGVDVTSSTPQIKLKDTDTNYYGRILSANGSIYYEGDESNGANGTFHSFELDNTQVMRIMDTDRINFGSATALGKEATKFIHFEGHASGSTAWSVDIPHTDDNSEGTELLITASFTHHPSYNAFRQIYFSRRGTGAQYSTDIVNRTTSNSGSWTISKPSNTVTRVTHNAGSYGGAGPWWVTAWYN